MLNRIAAACLVTTALTVAPALAQSNSSSGANSTSSQTANSTQDFATKAAESGMFEIQSSQLALTKSQDKDIRTFAQKMIDDHTKADQKLKSIAKNEHLPTSLDRQHQQMITRLQGDNGSTFAEDFKQMQVAAHQQAIELFQNYAKDGSDQQLKQFAEQTLPTLQDHLKMAQQVTIASNSGAATGATTGATTGASSTQTAQNSSATRNGAATQSDGNREYLTSQADGTWRASKVIGITVYNEQNQKVGDINEVLFDKSGKVSAVVIGVGGFLGLGERNVAVPYEQLQWEMTPPASNRAPATNTAATTPTGPAAVPAPGLGGPASPVTPAPGTGATRVSDNNGPPAYPDHAVLPNASKDQLQKAPEFKYGSAPR